VASFLLIFCHKDFIEIGLSPVIQCLRMVGKILKNHLLVCAASAIVCVSSPSVAQGVIPQPSDPAAQAVMAALVACGESKLGGKTGIDLAVAMGEQANRQIVAYCQAGNKPQAHETAVYYAGTEQGKVALECAAQLKPLVQQPAIQNYLGVYRNMVNEILNGQVPQDVCVGIRQTAYY
jgi:uncharacterized protein YwlG (UPF0340 family)